MTLHTGADPGSDTAVPTARPNGEALAAFLAAGIGSFAIGLFVILNTIGIFSAPALHAGAGGVSGRTTFAVVVWLIAWSVLHVRWRNRHMEPRPIYRLALILLIAGLIATFPPVWALL